MKRAFLIHFVLLAGLVAPAAGEEVRVSHCLPIDHISAINDRIEPKSCVDRPRHSFWPHKGTKEWVEYDFDGPRRLSGTEIYWLDDTPQGDCPLPESWRLFYREGDRWMPVENTSPYGVEKNVFNRVTFKPIETSSLRIEVQSRPGWGSGIIEWDVRDDPKLIRARKLKRLAVALDRWNFEPRRTVLYERVQQAEGFSSDAENYFRQLAQFKTASNRIRAKIESNEMADPKAIEAFAGQVDAFIAEQAQGIGPIAFFTRYPLSRPNAINCYIWQSVPERWGCSIRTYDPARPEAGATTIFSDPRGSIFDMNLSRDAKTLFFSFKRQDEPCWQLYEIGVDGQGLKKISRDPQHYEIGAVELPDGDLLFVSTRQEGFTVCQPGPNSNLHVMHRDGSNVRCVSQNTLSDFSPQLLPDGRVLFTRWEYIDRDLTYRQSLWTQNPDGRRYQLFFGNTVRELGTFWQCRPIPGHGSLVVSTFAPHHGWPHGAIGLVQNGSGPEAPRGDGYAWITQEFPQIEDRSFRWSYRDPYPIGDYQFLVSYGGGNTRGGRFGLYLLDLCDNRTPIYMDPEMGCYGPIPLRPRKTPPLVAALEESLEESLEQVTMPAEEPTAWGTVLVADVYRGLPDIERGRVKYIQIMQQMPKLKDLTHRAYDQSPVMGYATYYAKRCWGRVPVEADGSAHFMVPALKEVYLQVLDAEGRELQRMTSAIQLMPGETQSCIGCHEPRNMAPLATSNKVPAAFAKRPVQPEMPDWGTDGLVDFVRVVQPVLDRYCTECHSGTNPEAGYDLSGDKTRFFNMAYDNLLGRSRSYRQHDMAAGNMLATEAAREKPLVHFFWLLRTPTAVNRPLWTGSHASRLLQYVDTDHCGRMIPRADRQRVYSWIDANVPYYATYDHSRPNSSGYRDLFTDIETGREAVWYKQRFLGAYNRRCNACHGGFPQPNDHGKIWEGRYAWINFTHPEYSAVLTAHLAKESGGRGLGTESAGAGPTLFRDTKDPDYTAMLDAIRQGRREMLAHPRVDMELKSPLTAKP